MKASRLIEILNKNIKQHGDKEILINYPENTIQNPIFYSVSLVETDINYIIIYSKNKKEN